LALAYCPSSEWLSGGHQVVIHQVFFRWSSGSKRKQHLFNSVDFDCDHFFVDFDRDQISSKLSDIFVDACEVLLQSIKQFVRPRDVALHGEK
jgi:hypothetical protein